MERALCETYLMQIRAAQYAGDMEFPGLLLHPAPAGLALFFLIAAAALQSQSSDAVIVSTRAAEDWVPSADPEASQWKGIAGITAENDFYGKPAHLGTTVIRSRWTDGNLYLLYVCPFRELYLKPDPDTGRETNKLWDWDVAEAFIGSDFEHITRYKEFQVSPQGEYVDLDIDRENPRPRGGVDWQSGFTVKARIDRVRKIWYGEMRIPFSSLAAAAPKPGTEFRIGLFRIEGAEPDRTYVAWRPTGAKNFHVPAAFGRLLLK